jgi:phage gpG-like protein
MITGYSGVLTGFKNGAFTTEINTRYPDALHENKEMIENLITKRRPLASWVVRKTLEQAVDFKEAVEILSTAQICAPIYFVISGIREGTILARYPDDLAHQITLGENNTRYIVITNFDYWNDDWREHFDYTSEFRSRRKHALRYLD